MRSAAFVAAMVGTVMAAPQAVTSAIAPDEKTPDGCQTSYSGKFQVVVSALNKRSLETRQDTPLEITLKNGVMTDDKGRTGYIASNQQFQFDGPAQAGAIYTSGWSVCANNSIALGNSAIFYQCLSGTFYNLYDENEGQQCSPVYLNALGGAAASTATTDSVNTVICQIGDGQIQQNTCVTTATAMVVTQISDGQIQAPTGVKVSQISDGQVQAPTGAVVTQVSDGQIQAPTNGTGVVSPTPTAATTAAASASPSSFTGAAAFVTARKELFGLAAAGAMAVFAL